MVPAIARKAALSCASGHQAISLLRNISTAADYFVANHSLNGSGVEAPRNDVLAVPLRETGSTEFNSNLLHQNGCIQTGANALL